MGLNRLPSNKAKPMPESEEICFLGVQNYCIRVEPLSKCFQNANTIIYIVKVDSEVAVIDLEHYELTYHQAVKLNIKVVLILNVFEKVNSSIDTEKFVEGISAECKTKKIVPTIPIKKLALIDFSESSFNEESFYSLISNALQVNSYFSDDIKKILSILKEESAIIGAMIVDIKTYLCHAEYPIGLYDDFQCAIRNSFELYSQLQAKDCAVLPSSFEYQFTLTLQTNKYAEEDKECPFCEGIENDNKIVVYIVRTSSKATDKEKDLLIVVIKETHMQVLEVIKYNIKEALDTMRNVVLAISEKERKQKEIGIK